MSRNSIYTKSILLRLSEPDYQALKHQAKAQGISVSTIIRNSLPLPSPVQSPETPAKSSQAAPSASPDPDRSDRPIIINPASYAR